MGEQLGARPRAQSDLPQRAVAGAVPVEEDLCPEARQRTRNPAHCASPRSSPGFSYAIIFDQKKHRIKLDFHGATRPYSARQQNGQGPRFARNFAAHPDDAAVFSRYEIFPKLGRPTPRPTPEVLCQLLWREVRRSVPMSASAASAMTTAPNSRAVRKRSPERAAK